MLNHSVLSPPQYIVTVFTYLSKYLAHIILHALPHPHNSPTQNLLSHRHQQLSDVNKMQISPMPANHPKIHINITNQMSSFSISNGMMGVRYGIYLHHCRNGNVTHLSTKFIFCNRTFRITRPTLSGFPEMCERCIDKIHPLI